MLSAHDLVRGWAYLDLSVGVTGRPGSPILVKGANIALASVATGNLIYFGSVCAKRCCMGSVGP